MKTAISIPNSIFEDAEKLSQKLKISRSELYSKAVQLYLQQARIEEVTSKLNEVYQNASSNLDKDLMNVQAAGLPKEEW